MRLRDSEDRGFPSPLLLSYTTSSSFLSPIPCRSQCRWQRDADTSQSLPLSDERLLPPPRLTLLFNVSPHLSRSSLSSHISFCLVFRFNWWTFPFPFSLGSILSYLAPLSDPTPANSLVLSSLFLRMIEIVMVRECHDVGKSHDDCLSGAHWFNRHRQKRALLKAKIHRVQIWRQHVNHSRDDEKKATLQATAVSASLVPSVLSQQRKYLRRSHKQMLSVFLKKWRKQLIKHHFWLLIFL